MLTLVPSDTVFAWALRPLLRVEQAESKNLVAALAEAQLLDSAGRDRSTGLARYRFNPLMRLYAEQELRKLPRKEVDAARRRLRVAYLEVIKAVMPTIDPSYKAPAGSRQWVPDDSSIPQRIADSREAMVRAEYKNLVEAIRTAPRRVGSLSWRIAAQLDGSIPESCNLRENLKIFTLAMTAARRDNDAIGQLDIQLAKASFLIAAERYSYGFRCLAAVERAATDLMRSTVDDRRRALIRQVRVRRKVSEAYLQMGTYTEAHSALNEVESLAVKLDDKTEHDDKTKLDDKTELSLLGLLQAEHHRMVSSEVTHGTLLYSNLPDSVQYRALLSFADSARRMHNWNLAREHLEQILMLNRGDSRRIATVNYRLGRLHHEQWLHSIKFLGPHVLKDSGEPRPGMAELAVRRSADATLGFRQMWNPIGVARSQALLSQALAACDRLVEAEEVWQANVRRIETMRHFAGPAWLPLVARNLRARAELSLIRGEYKAGWPLMIEAAAIFSELGDWTSHFAVLEVLRRIPAEAGDLASASVGSNFSASATSPAGMPKHRFVAPMAGSHPAEAARGAVR